MGGRERGREGLEDGSERLSDRGRLAAWKAEQGASRRPPPTDVWVGCHEGARVPEPHHIHVRDDQVEAIVHHRRQHKHLGPGHAPPALLAPRQACGARARQPRGQGRTVVLVRKGGRRGRQRKARQTPPRTRTCLHATQTPGAATRAASRLPPATPAAQQPAPHPASAPRHQTTRSRARWRRPAAPRWPGLRQPPRKSRCQQP